MYWVNIQFLLFFFSEITTTPEKKVADSPVKEKKVPDSPAKKVESPVKEKVAENGSKAEEEDEDDDEVKENGASEEEEEVAEKEQNGDTKGLFFGSWQFFKLNINHFLTLLFRWRRNRQLPKVS